MHVYVCVDLLHCGYLHWAVPQSYPLYLMTIMFLKCLFPQNWTLSLTPLFSHTLHIVRQNNFLAQISNYAHNQSIFHFHWHHLELTTIISPLDYYNCLLIQLSVSTLVSFPGWTYITPCISLHLSLFFLLSLPSHSHNFLLSFKYI